MSIIVQDDGKVIETRFFPVELAYLICQICQSVNFTQVKNKYGTQNCIQLEETLIAR